MGFGTKAMEARELVDRDCLYVSIAPQAHAVTTLRGLTFHPCARIASIAMQ